MKRSTWPLALRTASGRDGGALDLEHAFFFFFFFAFRRFFVFESKRVSFGAFFFPRSLLERDEMSEESERAKEKQKQE